MKVYLIPGLGFDRRIFRRLELSAFDTNYLDWIEPDKKESFRTYAERLSESIKVQNEKIVLIGHSLGGMMSQEIASIKKVDKIILLSSIQSRVSLPFYFKMIQPLYLHRMFTKELTLFTYPLWGKWQDYDPGEQQELFKDMVRRQSNNYLQWALKELSTWQKPQLASSTEIFQIHGKRDKTLPSHLIKNADQVIEGAGHFMVYKHPELISRIIAVELEKL